MQRRRREGRKKGARGESNTVFLKWVHFYKGSGKPGNCPAIFARRIGARLELKYKRGTRREKGTPIGEGNQSIFEEKITGAAGLEAGG